MSKHRKSKTLTSWLVEKPAKGKKFWKYNTKARDEHVRSIKNREDRERFLSVMTDG